MKPITLFMFGYSGWGQATEDLLKAVDAVERGRGFQPPVFVDIRINRSVRAAGFSGKAFEKLLGEHRYRWMQSLGNRTARTGNGHPMKIAEPSTAGALLDAARELAGERRRVVVFCSCPFPKEDGKVACHRWMVGTLVLGAAKRRKIGVEVVEWPGGEPGRVDVKLSPDDFESVEQGRQSVPVGKRFRRELAGLPWASVSALHARGDTIHRLVGPATVQKGGWSLPVLWKPRPREADLPTCERNAGRVRKSLGLESRGFEVI